MASSVQGGVTFSLTVGLTTIPKVSIKPELREQIFDYIKSQLHLFQKHLYTVKEVDFFSVIGITKDVKTAIKLELSVLDHDGLAKLFKFSKYPPANKLNDLSYYLSTFFQNQEMQLKFGFKSSTKINILVSMSKEEKKRISAELVKKEGFHMVTREATFRNNTPGSRSNNDTTTAVRGSEKHALEFDVDSPHRKSVKTVIDQFEQGHSGQSIATLSENEQRKSVKTVIDQFEQGHSRQSIATLSENEQVSRIRRTFIIDVPDKEVISVKIRSHSLTELNREMFLQNKNIYVIDIELPMLYDTAAIYWYEITFKNSVMYFVNYTKEIHTPPFIIGEKTIHRDILLEKSSIYSHLYDIVKCLSGCYSESELSMQTEDVCSNVFPSDIEEIVRSLLKSDIMHSSKYLTRFAFVVGYLCRPDTVPLHKIINANTAHKILDALLEKKLVDYPQSCSAYMPFLYINLLKIVYEKDFCTLIFLNRASLFLSESLLLSTLQECIRASEKFVNDKQYCQKVSQDLCNSFLIDYLQTGSPEMKGILECLYRHLPIEMALTSYGQLAHVFETGENRERDGDALTAITASIKSQIFAFSNKSLKEKKVVSLLKMATMVGKFGLNNDTSIRNTFEESIISCFSWHSVIETKFEEEVKDCLRLSGCFVDLESQLQLLRSISESKIPSVRRLFLLLYKNNFFEEAYSCVEVDVYTSWLQNEVKTTKSRHEDEILSLLQTFCDILKLPVVSDREEVRQALENVTKEFLRRYTLKEVLQHLEKIGHICEKEPTVSNMYKDHIKELCGKKGIAPSEVLKLFCTTNGVLRVNSETTMDIVCSVIDLFFKKTEQFELFDAFINQKQHIAFWELLAKGEGKRIHTIKDNETFKKVMLCIKQVSYLLRNGEADIAFMTNINIGEEKTKRLLQLGGMTWKDVEAVHDNFKKTVEETKQTVRNVQEVLNEVKTRAANTVLPDLSVVIKKVEDIRAKIYNGNLSVKEAKSLHVLWGNLAELPEDCTALYSVITSAVFWNVTERAVFKSFTDYLKTATPLDGLLSVRYLFDFESLDNNVQEIENLYVLGVQNTEKIIQYLKILKEGIHLYMTKWKSLETDTSMPMQSVQEMFEKANVSEEIKTADKVLPRPVKYSVTRTLSQLSRKSEVLEKAKAMASVLEALGYNISNDVELHSALQSFQELVQQTISNYTLLQIQIALKTIFDLADSFTDIAVFIMLEIGKSSLLIDFLKDIAIEDVRNLIDAVEDISESHVQESTVSALIEVKRFLQPLLTPLNLHDKGSHWIFQTLQKQTSALGKNADNIPEKISDCCLHLHNLKSLYNNVANRGQQTKEIIKSIITKGKFSFMLCHEQERVLFEISYKENKNKFTKQEATVTDIRSRALLLLNTERQCAESSFNPDEFRVFVEYVDLCLVIRETLYDLYVSGHMKYKTFKLNLQSSELLTMKDKLNFELDEWIDSMQLARNKYYLMNFMQGFQIRTVTDFLESGTGKDIAEAVLKYIHPDLTAQTLSETFRKDHYLCNESSVLEELGRSLHEMYAKLSFYYRDMLCEDMTIKMTECVLRGKLLVTQLDENSEFVLRTVLALYRNTTRRYPEPNQLLLCTRDTSWNEIELLLERCKGSYSFYGSVPLYCIANVEVLQNEVQFNLVEELQNFRNCKDYLLALICRGSKNHPFVDKLNDSLVTVQPVSNLAIQNLFHVQFPHVFTYTSEVAGLGKTTNICKMSVSAGRSTASLHVSGQMQKGTLIATLNALKIRAYHTLHLDVGAVDEPGELDTFLFELVVMKFVACGKLAFYLQTENVCFEIANTINNTLRNSVTTITSFQREHLLWNDFCDFICSREVNSPVQVVSHYLSTLDKGVLDREELRFSGKNQVKPLQSEQCRALLKKHLNITTDLSFTTVHIFLNVLSDQLKKFSCSSFFKVSHIFEMIGQSTVPTVRSNLIKAMIDVSVEFAARSVNACRSTQSSTVSGNESIGENRNKQDELVAKIIHRTDGMIRWEESNHLIYVFHNQNIHTLSPMYRDMNKVPDHVRKLFESQMKRSLPDFSTMKQVELQNMLQRVARTSSTSLTEKRLNELSKDYALTPDNLLKMILIMLRIQSKVPIVIMGETGCGKTSLIRYLASICEVSFAVMNIHAGVNTSEIIDTVMQENTKCRDKTTVQRWLFLDEINTSENIGVICDIICHHKCNGCLLSPNLIIMGACNPYKLRTVEAIHTAGLTGKVRTDELSKLVYRVLPLPEMMVDFVWDFGSLSEKDEFKYITRMVEGVFCEGTAKHALLSDLLSISQAFVREVESSTCVVSLRDVQRCKTLVPWFISILKRKPVKEHLLCQLRIDVEVKAIILSLAHCYHSRFLDKSVRTRYRQKLLEGFKKNNYKSISKEDDLHYIIKEEQKDILNRMVLPAGTAKNTALQENVFVILVCILNRIPIFVVGKPGYSKSLAMQVIRSNLRGKDSIDEFFKTLPQLYCVSFQGSESSTSDGIVKVFEKAENYQKSNSQDSVLSVVILDEIGLAEISRFNPLKVLHNLLEPDGRSRPNVAVVGISNWALDASKMNRAIHLSRPDMDQEELFETAMSIGKSFIDSVDVYGGLGWNKKNTSLSPDDLKHELKLIANTYITYTKKLQFKHFHGLRDFYSLVKFIARTLAKDCMNLTPHRKSAVIAEGLLRNFGGLKSGLQVLLGHFKDCFQSNIQLSLSAVDLIKSNIGDTLARHLMVITKGESVLGILEHNLKESGRERKEIIFGSQFEEDLTDDYNYRILSRIILCMEQGIVLVLKDLENIYGSLYDMLNQNYTRIGKKNNCRVALGPYSNPFCHVADSFRCIVLVDENRVDYADPPFLNRFEKQFLSFSDILNSEESQLVNELDNWLDDMTLIEGKPFSKYSALPFFNEELIVSLVLYFKSNFTQSEISLIEECKRELLWMLRAEVIVRLSRVDAAVIQSTSNAIKDSYFQLPLHDGLENYIQHQVSTVHEEFLEQMTVVFTYSNIHTKVINELNNWHCQSEKLGAFKSEKQLSLKLQQFWSNADMQVLLVHCNAQEDDRHIMLTKSLIEKYRAEYLEKYKGQRLKFVYLVVHLGCRDFSETVHESSNSFSQINYLSGWKLVLLENLERPKSSLPDICSKSLLEVIEGLLSLSDCLKEELFWAFTRIQYDSYGRDVESINNIIEKIHNSDTFLGIIGELVWLYIQDANTGEDDSDWYVNVACDTQTLNTSASLIDALERHLRTVIKNPLAIIVFKLEHLGALDSYFIEDANSRKRREVWCANIRNECIFSYSIKGEPIKDVAGPGCYHCETPDLCLKLPFFRVIFEGIEETKGLFTDEVTRSKIKCELDPDDDLPEEVINEIILQQESFILKNISNILESNDMYESLLSDFIIDFCNLYSYTFTSVLDRETRTEYMQWLLKQKVNFNITDNIQLFTRIHCTGWSHLSLFGSAVLLLELCADVFSNENSNILVQFEKAKSELFLFDDKDGAASFEQISEIAEEENECISMSKYENERYDHELVGEMQGQDAIIDDTFDDTVQNKQAFQTDESGKSKEIKEYQSENQGDAEDDLCESKVYSSSENDVNEVFDSTQELSNAVDTIDLSIPNLDTLQTDEKKDDCTKESENELDVKQDKYDTSTYQTCDNLKEVKSNFKQMGDVDMIGDSVGTDQVVEVNTDVQSDNQQTHDISETASNLHKKVIKETGNLKEDRGKMEVKWSGDVIQDLVSFICTKMIPTTNNLIHFTDISRWQYLIRCLSTNTDTTAYAYLFKAVEEGIIPEEEIHLLKPPLNFLLQQELDEYDNRLKEIIVDGTEIDEKETESDEGSSGLLCALHSCISNLSLQGRTECPFVLLIIDLLQEIFETDEYKDSDYELMLNCGKIIQDNKFGLPYIAAVAYLKAAISYLTYMILNDDVADTSVLLNKFNAVLSGLVDMAVHKSMLDYFLKGLGKNSAISIVMKRCRYFEQEYPFFKSIEWTEGYSSKTVEGNPLVLNVPTDILSEGEACIVGRQTTESFQTGVQSLIALISKESVHGLLFLYSLMMKDFYLSRYQGMLDDTDMSRATIIWKMFEKHPFSAEQRNLMECLLGKSDFMCSHFMHGEESSFQQYMINSILVSMFALSLCCCKEISGQPLSFLTRCLLKPTQLRHCFLPGFPDNPNTIASETEYTAEKDFVFSLCGCGKRLLFQTHETTAVCVVCRREIPEDNLQILSFVNKSHLAQTLPGYTYRPHMIETEIAVRTVSDVSCNILQFLVKGCLLGSIALGITKHTDVEELIAHKSSELDVSSQLLTEIDHHWKRIRKLLNADDHDVGILFHSILHKGRQAMFEERNAFVKPSDRNHWETKFDRLVLSILDSRSQTIQQTINTGNKLCKLPQNSVEVVIREANELHILTEQNRREQMPSLFRLTARPTKMDFLCQLWPERKTYPFLTASLKHESLLVLPKHIYQILQWHLASVVNTSYTLKRYDCLKLTVPEFHDNLRDLNKRKLSKRKFEDFKHSWNILKNALENTDGFETLLTINSDTKIADCLILGTDCDIYRVLAFLISTQNNFIDLALQLAFRCKNLQYLLRRNDIACFKVVPVTELKKEHLIDTNFDWDESLSQESHSGLTYGLGKQICYDFHSIEKELAFDLLARKAYINLEALPNIVFTDELYRNFVSLLADVRHSVPQEVLPNDIEVAFVKTSRDMADMSLELMNYLDMILTLLKKTKCDSQKSLTGFVKERSNILGLRFPSKYLPSPESRVKLCHIISLHELLEELSVDRIIGSLSDEYNTELEVELNDHFTKMPGASLRKAEIVSKTLKKFIYRCILMGDINSKQPLLQFISDASFWPLTLFSNGKLKIDGKEEDIKEIIPSSMHVCHVVAAVTQLTENIETQKQGELRMDRVITSWKSKAESTSKTTRQKKAVKKLRKS